MCKILIGAGAAALWLVLAHTANAETVCHQVCDSGTGTCVSRCIDTPDSSVVVHEHDPYYRHYDDPGIHVGVPGVGVDIGGH